MSEIGKLIEQALAPIMPEVDPLSWSGDMLVQEFIGSLYLAGEPGLATLFDERLRARNARKLLTVTTAIKKRLGGIDG